MGVRQSVLGEVAVTSGKHVVSVDIGSLVRRLLLFDKVIIRSPLLREIPHLIRAFHKEGFAHLVESGLLQFSAGAVFLLVDVSRDGVRHVPLNHFSFGIGELAGLETALKKEFVALQGVPSLNNSDRAKIEETILAGIIRRPENFGKQLLGQFDHDIRTNNPVLKSAILDRLKSVVISDRNLSNLGHSVRVEEVRERVFRIDAGLGSVGLSAEQSHTILHDAVTAVANLDQRLAEMEAYSAITGFLDREAPLLFGRLAGIMAPQNPTRAETQFERVIEIADVPDFQPGQRVNVELLLKARDSAECRQFREWLGSLDSLSDAQIKDMLGALRGKLALMTGSTVGRVLRFAATTAAGLVPGIGLIAGPVTGAVDSFLIDKVLPHPGIVAFLSQTYPSLFVSA